MSSANDHLRKLIEQEFGGSGGDGTSWQPLDLAAHADGDGTPAPEFLRRSDAVPLLYRAKQHLIAAPPESGKGFFAHEAAREVIAEGEHAVYIDFEDGPASAVERQLALGTAREALFGPGRLFHYVRPEEPLEGSCRGRVLRWLTELRPALVVLDGLTEAYVQNGFSPYDNPDAARFNELLPKPAKHLGAAVLLIDHVVKDKEARGGYAIGAQHKRAHVDVALSLDIDEPFGRGRAGRVKVTLNKDRPGYLRQHQDASKRIAVMAVKPVGNEGGVQVTFEAPDQPAADAFRPTVLMERASRHIEENPGVGKAALRTAVGGKGSYTDLALDVLEAEKFIRVERGATGHRHHSIRPYSEATDPAHVPGMSQPHDGATSARVPACPSDVPGVSRGSGGGDVPVSPSLKGGTRDTPPCDVPLATPEEEARAASLGLSLTDGGAP